MPYAEVTVNAAAPLRQTFTYRIPDGMAVESGQAVYVPFGSRTLQGIVMDVTEEAAFPDARDIEALIEERPLLSPAHIALARWLSDHYLAPLFDCVSLMLPAGFKRRPVTVLRPLATQEELPRLGLTDKQRSALEYVIERGEAETEELRRALELTKVPILVSSLLRRGFLQLQYRLARPTVSRKIVPHLRAVASPDQIREEIGLRRGQDTPRALRRLAVLAALAEEGVLPLARARSLGLTAALLPDLEAGGLAAVELIAVVRDPLAGR